VGALRVLSTLESLDLSGPSGAVRNQRGRASGPLADSLVSAIAELKGLRVLKLGHSEIDERGLHQLAVLPKVEKLGLECCSRVGDETLKELAAWKALRYLDVQETKATQAGVAQLQAARPDLQILSGPFATSKSADRRLKSTRSDESGATAAGSVMPGGREGAWWLWERCPGRRPGLLRRG
jgi:hypothetical protein